MSTQTDGDHQKTKPELVALAAVYSPSDWVVINLIGQRLLQPNVVNVYGAGFSLYVDAGGEAPSSQWGRISLDALILAQYREKSNDAPSATGWEARLSVSGTAKVLNSSIAQVSLGPRILSSGDFSLFSTIALTYDADRLITDLLTPASGL